jgi:hypothetical protein
MYIVTKSQLDAVQSDIAIFFLSGSDFVPILLSKQDVALLLFPGNLVFRILAACFKNTRYDSFFSSQTKRGRGGGQRYVSVAFITLLTKIAYYNYLIGTWQHMISPTF